MKTDLKNTDPYSNLVKYSPEVLKKKTKINVESSREEIWIRIRFLEKNGSPSLLKSTILFLVTVGGFLSYYDPQIVMIKRGKILMIYYTI